MPWFKVDDSLESHPKVKSIPRPQRIKAIGLWTLAGSWAARHLTDGFVPDYMIAELSGSKTEANALVKVGMWSPVDGGYVFKDWHDWQPTKARVEAERDAAKERMRGARERKKGVSSSEVRANSSERQQDRSDEVRSTPRSLTPTRPDPTRPDPKDDGPRKRATQLPDTFAPNDGHATFAAENHLNLEHELAQFTDHHRAKGSTMKDWDASFRTWLRNAVKWRKDDPRPASLRVLPHASQIEQPPDGLTEAEYSAWMREQRRA